MSTPNLFCHAGLLGLKIFESPHCCRIERQQVRFPRSKKRRIRKKWANREINYRTNNVPTAYRMGKDILAHPAIVEQLKRKFGPKEHHV